MTVRPSLHGRTEPSVGCAPPPEKPAICLKGVHMDELIHKRGSPGPCGGDSPRLPFMAGREGMRPREMTEREGALGIPDVGRLRVDPRSGTRRHCSFRCTPVPGTRPTGSSRHAAWHQPSDPARGRQMVGSVLPQERVSCRCRIWPRPCVPPFSHLVLCDLIGSSS